MPRMNDDSIQQYVDSLMDSKLQSITFDLQSQLKSMANTINNIQGDMDILTSTVAHLSDRVDQLEAQLA